MNYLYFAEGAVETTGEAAMYPASSFIGLDALSATTTGISFKNRSCIQVDDVVTLKHASGKHKEVAELIASLLAPSPATNDKFIVVADEANGVYLDNGNGAGLTTPVEVASAN
jgi:hypothetical protein